MFSIYFFTSETQHLALVVFIDCKMIIRVLSLVFLFIVRLRFPLDKSIASVIRSRYNDEIVKQIRRFEKLE